MLIKQGLFVPDKSNTTANLILVGLSWRLALINVFFKEPDKHSKNCTAVYSI